MNYYTGHCSAETLEGAQLLITPESCMGLDDCEKDGIAGVRVETEKDCGKCTESGRNSVLVLNSRDAGDPNCPRRLRPDTFVKDAIKRNDIFAVKHYASENKNALSQPDKTGLTPFHYACWYGCIQIVFFLIETVSHENLKVTDSQGWTALHFACDARTSCLQIIKCLLKDLGLNPRQETNKGSTPASLAKYRAHYAIVKLLTDIMSVLRPISPEDQRPELVNLKVRPELKVNREDLYESMQTSDHPNGDRNMSRLENRLFTFTMGSGSWPRAHPTERQLAEQGFVYSGVEERVFCFCCKAVVSFWDDGVDPLLKHYNVSHHCQFILLNFRPQLDRLLAQHRITHFNSDYATNGARLHSFQMWKYSDIVSSFKLASAGFYYLGVGLQTQCFSCGLTYNHWRRGDIPFQVHRRLYPHCEFLQSLERDMPSIEPPPPAHVSTPIKPNYENLEIRIKSFKLLPKQVPVSGEECAKAGLFFLRKPDIMQCFTCNAIVRSWIVGDVPVEKHREISPQCKFLCENFPTKLEKETYRAESKLRKHGTKDLKSSYKYGSLPIDPSSLPEPEFTKEDLEQMNKEENELANFSLLSLQQSDHRQRKLIRSQESGYESNPLSSKLSSESSDASLYTQNSSLSTTFTQQHYSLESPAQRKPAASKSSQPTECVVCMDNSLEVVLLPCGHCCMCQSCAHNIDQCPMCRRPVESTLRVFMP